MYNVFLQIRYQIDKDRVITGGMFTVFIVNVNKCMIEHRIKDVALGAVYCFIKLRDSNTILCGCGKGKFCLYDRKTKRYNITINNHDNSIHGLLSIDDKTFISCSWDYTIKVWKY